MIFSARDWNLIWIDELKQGAEAVIGFRSLFHSQLLFFVAFCPCAQSSFSGHSAHLGALAEQTSLPNCTMR